VDSVGTGAARGLDAKRKAQRRSAGPDLESFSANARAGCAHGWGIERLGGPPPEAREALTAWRGPHRDGAPAWRVAGHRGSQRARQPHSPQKRTGRLSKDQRPGVKGIGTP